MYKQYYFVLHGQFNTDVNSTACFYIAYVIKAVIGLVSVCWCDRVRAVPLMMNYIVVANKLIGQTEVAQKLEMFVPPQR